MHKESEQYLQQVACVARANLVFHQQKPQDERNLDESGAALLMSAYLEMYDHWQSVGPGIEPPPQRVYLAASSCVGMRKQLERQPRSTWSDEEEGLFQLMTAYMFLFKNMYVTRH